MEGEVLKKSSALSSLGEFFRTKTLAKVESLKDLGMRDRKDSSAFGDSNDGNSSYASRSENENNQQWLSQISGYWFKG